MNAVGRGSDRESSGGGEHAFLEASDLDAAAHAASSSIGLAFAVMSTVSRGPPSTATSTRSTVDVSRRRDTVPNVALLAVARSRNAGAPARILAACSIRSTLPSKTSRSVNSCDSSGTTPRSSIGTPDRVPTRVIRRAATRNAASRGIGLNGESGLVSMLLNRSCVHTFAPPRARIR